MRVLVIGGGAAGCMAAACAAERGAEVVILEKNQNIGKKLRITGKGRCNVTNACDMEGLMQNIPRGGRFLYSAFSHCLPQDVMDWFEARGVRLKVERGNRVFPESDQAAEIVETLRRTLDSLGVTIVHDTVTGLACDDRGVTGAVCGPRTYSADAVILAAGGATYPGTGSTGDGFTLAQSVGHTVTPLQPSLVPLETLERDCAEMMGISLKNVRLTLRRDDRAVFTEMEEQGFAYEIETIAMDGLVFLVNENNPVDSLTTDQIRDIYTGKITNWSQVGGSDAEIIPFQRNEGAGSQALMKKLVMGDTPLAEPPEEYMASSMGELMSVVKSYDNSANAIGYSVYYYANDMQMAQGLKLLKVDGVEPSRETIRSGEYPHRNAYYCVIPASAAEDSPNRILFDWLMSEDGQKLIDLEGYVAAGK